MTAAYVLAGELARASGRPYTDALHRYENLLRPYIESKQRAARSFSGVFAPKTSLGLLVRNLVIAATTILGLARLVFWQGPSRWLALPEYAWR
jgi:2-polyprenyl-6-methoxyphenol hydroxylase-like FAD-dependent oxidoreductase